MDDAASEFEQLVDAWYRPLFRFAMSLCGSKGTACDLVQQTFYAWAEKGHQLRDRNKAKAWLFTTLHREFLQLVRRESRLVPLEDDDDAPAPDEQPPPGPEVIEGIEAEDLYAAMGELPEVFKVALSLYYLEAFTYTQIAELLGVPIGTVMSRLARGKQKLRRKLVAMRSAAHLRTIPFQPRTEANHG
jgi:RNA polymerase sigma-70 factor (ECF subfamily)